MAFSTFSRVLGIKNLSFNNIVFQNCFFELIGQVLAGLFSINNLLSSTNKTCLQISKVLIHFLVTSSNIRSSMSFIIVSSLNNVDFLVASSSDIMNDLILLGDFSFGIQFNLVESDLGFSKLNFTLLDGFFAFFDSNFKIRSILNDAAFFLFNFMNVLGLAVNDMLKFRDFTMKFFVFLLNPCKVVTDIIACTLDLFHVSYSLSGF